MSSGYWRYNTSHPCGRLHPLPHFSLIPVYHKYSPIYHAIRFNVPLESIHKIIDYGT